MALGWVIECFRVLFRGRARANPTSITKRSISHSRRRRQAQSAVARRILNAGGGRSDFNQAEIDRIRNIRIERGLELRLTAEEDQIDEADNSPATTSSDYKSLPSSFVVGLPDEVGMNSPKEIQARVKSLMPTEPKNTSGHTISLLVEKLLGDGSFGRVYLVKVLATNKVLARADDILDDEEGPIVKLRTQDVPNIKNLKPGSKLALKVVKKKRIVNSTLHLKHIRNERQLLQAMSMNRTINPFIVEFAGAFQTHQKLCILTEFCEGGDMYLLLRWKDRFPEDWVQFYLAEITWALFYLHEHLIMYRDLKPENICIANDGHVKLVDFGLSKGMVSQHDNYNYSVVGTFDYIAPEVAMGLGHGHPCDWWALGILGFDMTTGRPPMREKVYAQVNVPKEAPTDLKDLLGKVLTVDPRFRAKGDEVIEHKYFDFIGDWLNVQQKGLVPPYIPTRDGVITPEKIGDDYLKGVDSVPRLRSQDCHKVPLESQSTFDYFSGYSGYFEHTKEQVQLAKQKEMQLLRAKQEVTLDNPSGILTKSDNSLKEYLLKNPVADDVIFSDEDQGIFF